MTNYEIKMPAGYAAIDEEEMTYLVGGADPSWLSYLKNVGTTFNYVARVFSSITSVINNISTIYSSVVWLRDNVPTMFGASKS